MNNQILCNPYAWEHPGVLLHTDLAWRYERRGCVSDLANHIIAIFGIAAIVGLGVLLIQGQQMALTGCIVLATFYCLPAIIALIRIRHVAEAFKDSAAAAPAPQPAAEPSGIYHVIGSGSPASNTSPTARNPLMNVLIDEIKYNPHRGEAVSVLDPATKLQLDDFFRTDFTSDPTDVFGRSQSQREFITMPSTSIPNDQGSYQNWLYKIPGKTCKEGGREACLPGTDGAALPWLNVDG
jgi:hypothetical protein